MTAASDLDRYLSPPRLLAAWPLVAAALSAIMLAIAHGFETFGRLAPCELCLRQREVYWVALAVGLIGFVVARMVRGPKAAAAVCVLLGLVFLYGAGVAAYHAGVEWKFWPGPQACTGGGAANAAAIADLLSGDQVAPPRCDQAAWRFGGVSMAGWNALISLGLAGLTALVVLRAVARGSIPRAR